jgi:hypothetical protein
LRARWIQSTLSFLFISYIVDGYLQRIIEEDYKQQKWKARLEDFEAMLTNILVLCKVTPCRLLNSCRRLAGVEWLNLRGQAVNEDFDCLALKMEVVHFSLSTRRNVPQDLNALGKRKSWER